MLLNFVKLLIVATKYWCKFNFLFFWQILFFSWNQNGVNFCNVIYKLRLIQKLLSNLYLKNMCDKETKKRQIILWKKKFLKGNILVWFTDPICRNSKCKKVADFYAKLHLFSTQYRKNRAKSLCFLLLTSMYKKLRSKLKYWLDKKDCKATFQVH